MLTLVTGASGHMGNNLVRELLAEKREVRVVVHNRNDSLAGFDIEQVRGDVCDFNSLAAAFKSADIVYHLAAVVSIADDAWARIEPVNVRGVQNVVAACLKAGVKRLVHFSSIHAMCQVPLNEPLDESRFFVGDSHPPYDRSKAAGEEVVRNGIARGLDAVIIAPTGIIGPYDYQPSHTGQMLLSLAQGKLPALVEGGFDWVDVRDVVRGAISAEKTAACGSKYILSGHWASLAELASITGRTVGIKPPSFVCPYWLANACAPLMTAYEKLSHRRPLYTRASMKAVLSNHSISHAHAGADLGYEPRPLTQTVVDTLLWFQKRGVLPEHPV